MLRDAGEILFPAALAVLVDKAGGKIELSTKELKTIGAKPLRGVLKEGVLTLTTEEDSEEKPEILGR